MYRLAKASGKKVITIEDPVEIEEESFLQLQVNKKIEQGYDELIKLSLRHQPELLIIGEIRDQVTATAAVRAALTGHTVFATLHIRELAQAEMRLIELGASASVVAECLQGVIYQEIMQVEEQRGMLAGYRFKVANTWQVEQDFANSLQEVRGEGEWK
jgi:competence protein ComGA